MGRVSLFSRLLFQDVRLLLLLDSVGLQCSLSVVQALLLLG